MSSEPPAAKRSRFAGRAHAWSLPAFFLALICVLAATFSPQAYGGLEVLGRPLGRTIAQVGGAIGFAMGAIGWIKREDPRVVALAMGIGLAGIFFEYFLLALVCAATFYFLLTMLSA